MTSFEHSESIEVDAPPEAVYDLVTDIARTGEWSPICRAGWWRDGDGCHVGAWFVGRNEAGDQVWETESQVVAAERGREFAWLVGGRYARWGYRFEALPDGRTRLTEDWEFLPEGQQMFQNKYGPEADARMALRRQQAKDGIPATLAAIKRVAEGEPPPD